MKTIKQLIIILFIMFAYISCEDNNNNNIREITPDINIDYILEMNFLNQYIDDLYNILPNFGFTFIEKTYYDDYKVNHYNNIDGYKMSLQTINGIVNNMVLNIPQKIKLTDDLITMLNNKYLRIQSNSWSRIEDDLIISYNLIINDTININILKVYNIQ